MNFIPVMELSDLRINSHVLVTVGNRPVLLSNYENKISAIGNICLHKAGPLDKGLVNKREGGYFVQCPWHGWEYNVHNGKAPESFGDQQAVYEVRVEGEKILISEKPVIPASAAKHKDNPLEDLSSLKYETGPGTLNVLGISTTNMHPGITRISTSEEALYLALNNCKEQHGAATKLIRLRDLEFRACEGYYSIHERACTWPCSISEMDPKDGMNEVYRSLVLWADIIFVATPIRWGNPSSLYFKMCERLNCVQNQITLHDRILIKNKVAAFLITGGQDNIQQVAGQMSCFFTDLGFALPPFNFVGWSRGWNAEDMDQNVEEFKKSKYIRRSVNELVTNSVSMSRHMKLVDYEKMDSPLPKRKDIRD
ncbi:MAG: (2Fe-2S)-binding protein [Bacteroidetes bacterium]|nr:MAG: (2Fe-2S)-binding protein [Bacteroidota bacterium]REK03563.1 MAG: (2Fe-2S)-binding protein [Bacteroidota bacterium]REK34855.1 MAG: (2Fe-2S)-binding protein [Bacteroidota bacterium]REK51224.1 MAG: (2Fe-2S)-binding protein [Bacteroidota bacterium]